MGDKYSITQPSENIGDSAPKTTGADVVHALTKGVLGSVPLVGNSLAETFSLIFTAPSAKRRDEWIELIVESLKDLEKKVDGFSMESLQEDENFVTALAHASQIAIRNHHKEKINSLRNAVLNVAVRDNPDEDLILMFLGYVDTFTEWHLHLLRFLDDPRNWFAANGQAVPNVFMGATSTVMEKALHELQGRRNFYDLIVKDLYAKGLLSVDSLHTMMSADGVMASRTTGFGKQFLEFISAPGEG